jgi:hypothetical protein
MQLTTTEGAHVHTWFDHASQPEANACVECNRELTLDEWMALTNEEQQYSEDERPC